MEHIFTSYNTDLVESAYSLMTQAGIHKELSPSMKVVILPDLSAANHSREGATTHTEIVEGVVQYLHSKQVTDISIVQSVWMGYSTHQAFAVSGYFSLAKKYNLHLVDVDHDLLISVNKDNIDFRISKTAYFADYLINIPVLKAHTQFKYTCCYKNLLACIPSVDKRRLHIMGMTRSLQILSQIIKSDLQIVDNVCSDFVSEHGGTPLYQDRIYLTKNAALATIYGGTLLGFDPYELRKISKSRDNRQGDIYKTTVHTLVEENDYRPPYTRAHARLTQTLSFNIRESKACAPCFSAVIIGIYRALEEEIITKEELSSLQFHVGKKHRGKSGKGIGVGICCQLFDHSIPLCPPRGIDVVNFIKEYTAQTIKVGSFKN